jgi:hypothetical protein
MVRQSNPALFIACIILSLLFVSCSSVRYQQGFSYQPVYAGPDVSSGQGEEKEFLSTGITYPPAGENTGSSHQTGAENTGLSHQPGLENTILTHQVVIPETTAEAEILSGIISREYTEQKQSGQTLSTREKLHKMASDYAISTNKELTGKQLRKLDRLAAKMEKKQKKDASDVSWGPSDNLEWFILLGAGVALVVGILGVGFGWFVFLGLALVYLYLKLLKNN